MVAQLPELNEIQVDEYAHTSRKDYLRVRRPHLIGDLQDYTLILLIFIEKARIPQDKPCSR